MDYYREYYLYPPIHMSLSNHRMRLFAKIAWLFTFFKLAQIVLSRILYSSSVLCAHVTYENIKIIPKDPLKEFKRH